MIFGKRAYDVPNVLYACRFRNEPAFVRACVRACVCLVSCTRLTRTRRPKADDEITNFTEYMCVVSASGGFYVLPASLSKYRLLLGSKNVATKCKCGKIELIFMLLISL